MKNIDKREKNYIFENLALLFATIREDKIGIIGKIQGVKESKSP